MRFYGPGECRACGDDATTYVKEVPYCGECMRELVTGQFSSAPVHFIGGHPATMEDDSGPWNQNAIRAMEDLDTSGHE